jgi:hypothetical protein
MNTGTLRRRLKKLDTMAARVSDQQVGVDMAERFQQAVSRPGVWPRLHQIAEHGASPDDLEWVERQTAETGIDFPGVIQAMAQFEEEY